MFEISLLTPVGGRCLSSNSHPLPDYWELEGSVHYLSCSSFGQRVLVLFLGVTTQSAYTNSGYTPLKLLALLRLDVAAPLNCYTCLHCLLFVYYHIIWLDNLAPIVHTWCKFLYIIPVLLFRVCSFCLLLLSCQYCKMKIDCFL